MAAALSGHWQIGCQNRTFGQQHFSTKADRSPNLPEIAGNAVPQQFQRCHDQHWRKECDYRGNTGYRTFVIFQNDWTGSAKI
jgi:hypothetical protein